MIFLLAVPAVAGFLLVSDRPALPHLDIRRTCLETAGSDGMQKCLADERYAERKLREHWADTPLASKRECLLDPLPPSPSYMVLRDCINNAAMVQRRARP